MKIMKCVESDVYNWHKKKIITSTNTKYDYGFLNTCNHTHTHTDNECNCVKLLKANGKPTVKTMEIH